MWLFNSSRKWFKYSMPPKKKHINQRESQFPSGANNIGVGGYTSNPFGPSEHITLWKVKNFFLDDMIFKLYFYMSFEMLNM